MGFRLLVIAEKSQLNCHSGYLVVHQETEIVRVHISEIDAIMIENPKISFTGNLINKLVNENIAIMLCDDKHSPTTLVQNIAGHHRRTAQIKTQIRWTTEQQYRVWQFIVMDKIRKQRHNLYFNHIIEELLLEYENTVELHDCTNREGMAAKVYFNRLFGPSFTREAENSINWALNYGYAILLMYFTRTIVGKGYLTELGIKHKNEYNAFNLACDFMEPFRPIVDYIVKKVITDTFSIDQKRQLQKLGNMKVLLNGKMQYIPQAIELYTQKLLNALESDCDYPVVDLDITPITQYEF